MMFDSHIFQNNNYVNKIIIFIHEYQESENKMGCYRLKIKS